MDFQTIKIDKQSANQRTDRFLRKFYKKNNSISLSLIYNRLRKWTIKLNNKKTKENYSLKIWDELKIPKENKNSSDLPPLKKRCPKDGEFLKKLKQTEIKSLIVYEDEDRIVWNKPAWIMIHRNQDTWSKPSMQDYLEQYCKYISLKSTETFAPSFCFRLDKDTSGILIAAKNYESLQGLNEIIRERQIDKNYLTIVTWFFPEHRTCDKSLHKVVDKKFNRWKMIIDNERWKECFSEFRLTKKLTDDILGEISLLKVKIETWRMHQIRVHLASLWYPVIWDMVYGKPSVNKKLFKKYKIQRQLLHCRKYSFERKGKKISFSCEPSENIWKV